MGADDNEATRRHVHLPELSTSTDVTPAPQPLLSQTLSPATAAHVKMSPSELTACQAQLQEMYSAGVIELNTSPLAQDPDPRTQIPDDGDGCPSAEDPVSSDVNNTAPTSAFEHSRQALEALEALKELEAPEAGTGGRH